MVRNSHPVRCFVALLSALVAFDMVSCSDPTDTDSDAATRLGTAVQALTDTDSDGMDDGWETTYFGNLSATAATDADSDGMTNLEEYLNGFVPNVDDAFADADGDRYPNVFEVRGSSDPNSSSSTPAPTYTVNGAGGGTHTTVNAALTAANVANGTHQIIAIAQGVYTGAGNLNFTLESTKPKLLFIGLDGAAETIIDGGQTSLGWRIQNSAVIASLTFRNTTGALRVQSPAKYVRFVDLVVRDNTTSSTDTSGLRVVSVAAGGMVHVVGSTFLDNTGAPTIKQIYVNSSTVALVNTVVWSQTSGTMVGTTSSGTLTTNYCLVKGQTLSGTGNLAGNADPKLGFAGHILWDSPLRGAGGVVAQSRIDIDGELRPSTAPDIGVDQFNDSDGDELADQWELQYAGNLTTLTGRSQDGDADTLSNEGEYANGVDPGVADTDGDGISDGDEVLVHGSDPLSTDSDRDEMPDGWEISHGLAPLVANAFDDDDGDRYPNVFEYTYSTDPSDGASTPTPTYLVNGAGGGTHATISAALAAANVANGAYQIIAIAPGVYTGAANLSSVSVASTKPKLLFIGLGGAATTIIDGEQTNSGWSVQNSAVVSSLTFRKTAMALRVQTPAKEVRFVDLIVRDNATTSTNPSGLQISSGVVHVVGSTFLDNTGASNFNQIYVNGATAALVNTLVWSQTSGTMVGTSLNGTLITNYCLVKGQTLTGTGNLPGNVNPKLFSDGHLLWDSPLRGAGGVFAQSRIDIDGELRPSTGRDIGVDQFNDSDSDELADRWELQYAGDLVTLTSRAQDGDGDNLSNEGEFASGANPVVADTDGDAVSDGDEVLVHSSNPLSTDTDLDEMPDGWEISHGLSPVTANALGDDDGDRYPNVFEYIASTDPSSSASIPAPTYTVDGAGGGTHTTISAALTAANVANGAYQIIAIAPGVYMGAANLSNVSVSSTKPKLLFIGLEGAAKTVIDGGQTDLGWSIQNSAVISSLTFRKTKGALRVQTPAKEVRFVDLIVRDNTATSQNTIAGLNINTGATDARVYVLGSTFLDNTGLSNAQQIMVSSGATVLANTVVWNQTSGTMVGVGLGGTLTANNSLVKGHTLTGTGNLAGNVDPKLRWSDARLRLDSPLRSAGGSVAQSRLDMDGEIRPNTAPDIGADQFNDSDSDGLPDVWEFANVGSTTSMVGSEDEDNDLLTNAAEYHWETNWLDPDMDSDGAYDGVEVALGTNPFVADSDTLTSDMNHDGLIDSIGLELGYLPQEMDSDGDSISNENEALMCTNPQRTDSDEDGVPDGTDPFPLDPLMSTLPADPQDEDAPVITLTAPWYAVEQ